MTNPHIAIRLSAIQLVLATTVALAADPATALHPPAGIQLEYIGQGLVVSPAEVYQYGYFTHVAGVESLFGGVPNDASTAFFTFSNELSTTRVTANGPLRIVDREGTATIYLNPDGGATFEDPGSFSVGTPVLTAALRHQVILDTLNGNTIIVNFDLTIAAAELFTVGEIKHRLGRPGEKLTWTAYGRPNTSVTQPGQFVFAGMGFRDAPAPLGLSIHPPASSDATQLGRGGVPGINLEYIGQGLVVSPAEVYQYGYFTHVAGVESSFSDAPNDASNAFFTFLNELSTTRVTANGPLRIVDREGTAAIYLNPDGGARFEDPGSFSAGTPVLTAALRHQVILDTLNGNTIIVNFDLTITDTEPFTVGEIQHRLGRPGEKWTWTAYGRPNTSASQPGQFVFAGMGFTHDSAPLGWSIQRPTGSDTMQLGLNRAAGISLEYVGQGLVVSPDEVYQYGYFTHVAGVESSFSGAPNNASNAFFTFLNELSTTRVTANGPLRIVDREGTAAIYLNPDGGASFEDPGSFGAGTPVLTAALRHQVILDTLNGNTIIVNFDLTVTAAEPFTVGEIQHRLGRPGERLTWTAYGRPNTSATQPGQFVFAGMSFRHAPAP